MRAPKPSTRACGPEREALDTLRRIEAHMRRTAGRQAEPLDAGPFTFYAHPDDHTPFFNYAIPRAPAHGELAPHLARLGDLARRHHRAPRVEIIAELWPDLVHALAATGWTREQHGPLLVCTPGTLRAPPAPAGLEIREVQAGDAAGARAFHRIQHEVFRHGPAQDDELPDALGPGRAYLAYLEGAPVAAAGTTPPAEGAVEIVGVATRPTHRRRGLGAALTHHAAREAFRQGVPLAFLTTGTEEATRVYERVGFRRVATFVAYRAEERP